MPQTDTAPPESGPGRAADLRGIWAGLLVGCGLALGLVAATLVRYPGNAATQGAYLAEGGIALGCLAGLGGWVLWRAPRRDAAPDAAVVRRGAGAGLLFGIAWVLEISFNNFAPLDISVGASRFWVDNGVWAAITWVSWPSRRRARMRAGGGPRACGWGFGAGW